jgi:RimJ/RimL family protein N-acetyltransferase
VRPADPPYRIQTARLVIRSWEPGDAPLLADAVDASLDDLRPWMPWAHEEPKPLSERVELLRHFRGQFDLGQDFVYGIFTPDESEVVGGTGLHTRRGVEALEIGYWIRTSQTGHGFATEAAGALTRIAFEVCGVDRVEIRVEPANARSVAIPRRLGFAEEATLRLRLRFAESAPRDVVVFTLFRDAFAAGPLTTVPVEAHDAAGDRVL